MSATAGTPLGGDAHLSQSIADILTTPIGSRVMRRDYGSAVFELIDRPLIGANVLRLFGAVAVAIRRWEPRFLLRRVQLDATAAAAGRAVLSLTGTRAGATANSLVTLTIPLRGAAA